MSAYSKIFTASLIWICSAVLSFGAPSPLPNAATPLNEFNQYMQNVKPKPIDQKYYMPYSLHVKTKFHLGDFTMQKDMESLLGYDVMQLIGDFKIDAPFAQYVNRDLLSIDHFGVARIYELHYSGTVNPFLICEMLKQNPNIESADPIFIRYQDEFIPNDPRLGEQYAMTVMKASQAWSVSKGSDKVVIAIVDSGTDWQHTDLSDNIWINPGEIPGNGIDDDGNGKIDDIYGWDFIGNITTQEYFQGVFKENNDPKNPNNNHGTLSAGCASAVTNNAIGIASLGYSAKIMSVKCSADNPQLRGILRGYQAILYAAASGAHIINCSWGGPGRSSAEQDIINQVTAMGVLVVASAGNDASNNDVFDYYPCNYVNVLSVGASASNERPASFSNFGHNVNVFAPGASILSTTLNNGFTRADGTSFSGPIVAGLAALVKSIHPEWSPMQIARQIRSTSDNVLSPQNPSLRPLFYGRANAEKAVKYNNPDFPDLTVPGFYCTSFKVNDQLGAITSYDLSKVILNITNFLSPAHNTKIILSPYRDFVDIKTNEIDAGNFGNLETKEIEVELQLKSNNPWYDGFIELLITYQSGDYVDYQLISVPVKLQSDSKYTVTQTFSPSNFITWYGAHTPSRNIFWAVGNVPGQGSVFYRIGGQTRFNLFTNEPAYCVYAFNENLAFFGSGPTNGAAKIWRTTDGGVGWASLPVNTITPFVNSIHFYDNDNGLFLGDPASNLWGIAATNNGGSTWTRLTNIPPPLSNETGYVESVAYHANSIWFGTSSGRVFRSTNRGQIWEVSDLHLGGSISKMDFLNNNIGFVVYQEVPSGTAGDQYLATTVDGGKTWTKRVFNFTANQILPISVYAIRDAELFAITSVNGSVFISEDRGLTFKPKLTRQSTSLNVGTGFSQGSQVRLWSAGRVSVGFLDFEVTPANIRKEITVVNETPVNFGRLDTNQNVIKRVDFRNDGNVRLAFESFEIIPGQDVSPEEFRIVFNRPTELMPGESAGLAVRFQPKVYGSRRATLIVKSDSEPSELTVELIGEGTDDISSVYEDASNLISISPNPAGEFIKITHTITGANDLKILDPIGREMISYSIPADRLHHEINIAHLSIGAYYIVISTKNGFKYSKQFIKN